MGKLWFDPHLESWFWFLKVGPGSDVFAGGVDGATIPVKRLLRVEFHYSALQLCIPPHFLSFYYR